MITNLVESDILFSPSRWSKRFASNVIFEKHIDVITKHSEDVRNQVPCHLDISYGPGEREFIDIYGTDLPDDAPLLLHIHGGYWHEQAITHKNNSLLAKCLYKNGIKTVLIGYELCPHVSIPDIVRRLQVAFHKCLDYAKKHRSSGIHVSGHSAGAHLVAVLHQTFIPSIPIDDQKLFKSAFLLCGLYDLLPLLDTQVNEILELDEESAKAMSPLHNDLFGCETHFYVVVVQHDSPVFQKQSKRFNDYLVNLGLSSSYVFLENVDHYEILENMADEDFKVMQMIVTAIKC